MTNLLILLTLTPELNNQYRDRLKAKFPELKVDLVDHHSKVGPYIGSADILLTFAPRLSDDVLRAGTRLKWVQALGTGVDNLIDRPVLRKDVIVTNVHGIHGPPVSEAAIGSMLALARDIPRACVRKTGGSGRGFRRSFCTTRPSGSSALARSPRSSRRNARRSGCAPLA